MTTKKTLKAFLMVEVFLIFSGFIYSYFEKEITNFSNLITMVTSGMFIPFYFTLKELTSKKINTRYGNGNK